MNRQRGFTLSELIAIVIMIVWLCIVGAISYVAWHFIFKLW